MELTTHEAKGLITFSQYRGQIEALIAANAFETKNGSVTMNFNGEGRLMVISITITPYRYGKTEQVD